MRIFLLLALCAGAVARPLKAPDGDSLFSDALAYDYAPRVHDYSLFEAAYRIVEKAGTGLDFAKLDSTRGWAPVSASVTHVADDSGREVSDVYTIRIPFAQDQEDI